MRRLTTLALALAVLSLWGCAVGPRYSRPTVFLPKNWSVDQSSRETPTAAPGQWWALFNDAELSRLIERASKVNLDLKLASARVAEARAQTGIAKAGLLPSVNATVSASRNRQLVIAVSPGNSKSAQLIPVEFNNYQGSFDASRELDAFGRVRRGLQAAHAEARAAIEARRAVLVTILA